MEISRFWEKLPVAGISMTLEELSVRIEEPGRVSDLKRKIAQHTANRQATAVA
jgi:hypothetical protein